MLMGKVTAHSRRGSKLGQYDRSEALFYYFRLLPQSADNTGCAGHHLVDGNKKDDDGMLAIEKPFCRGTFQRPLPITLIDGGLGGAGRSRSSP